VVASYTGGDVMEEYLLQLLLLSFYINIGLAIITFALIIALVVILSK